MLARANFTVRAVPELEGPGEVKHSMRWVGS